MTHSYQILRQPKLTHNKGKSSKNDVYLRIFYSITPKKKQHFFIFSLTNSNVQFEDVFH